MAFFYNLSTMTKQELTDQIKKKSSYLCVGLDSDPDKIPPHLKNEKQPLLTFNKAIIDATQDLCVAYKPNTAFYEAMGPEGWEILQETIAYIPDEHLVIADAKRGDIGNTCKQYAKAFFEQLDADAITVAPYMGADSVTPFLEYEDRWVILLAATSNPSAADFEFLSLEKGGVLYEQVLKTAKLWAGPEQLMFVVGATRPEVLKFIRSQMPDYFFLIPGVGAQGGSLAEVSEAALTSEGGILVNSSRGIIYAGDGKDFDKAAREAAKKIQSEMHQYLDKFV